MKKQVKILLAAAVAAAISGGVVSADTITVSDGSTQTLGAGEYSGIDVSNNSVVNINAAGSNVTFNGKKVYNSTFDAYNDIQLNNGTMSIKADTLTFKGLAEVNDIDPDTQVSENAPGQDNFAAWQAGNSSLTIDVNELYIGQEGYGDRGFQFKGGKNQLTIHADKIISYTGDGFINAQGNETGDSTVNIGTADDRIGYFEAHTTFGKGDYGVALLQANEGNTVNLYAENAWLDGSTYKVGGVIGTGGYGTVNVDVTGTLKIDGNICGTYGGRNDSDKQAVLKVHAGTLDMKGDINIGSEGSDKSDFSRNTNVSLTVDNAASIVGDINVWGNTSTTGKDVSEDASSLDLTLNGDSVITGTINVKGTGTGEGASTATVNLGGTGDMTASSGKFNVSDNGNVNFTGGTWAINEWNGEDGNLSIGKGAAVEVNDNITVSKVTLSDGSTTIVNGDKLDTTNPVITAGTGSSIADTADIVIKGIDTDTDKSLKLFSDTALNKAAADNVRTDNLLQQVTFDDKGNMTVGTVDGEKAAQLLGGSALTNVALAATDQNLDGVTALITNNASDTDAVKAALNSAAGLSGLANVAHGTYTMNGLFSDAVSGHLMNRQDQDVWVYGFHSKENVNGLSFGADYDAQYNGIAAGADFYRKGGTAAGLALIYADSNVSGANGVSSTKNDADYYGVSLYSRFDRGSYALLGDISYMKGDHDITQVNSGETITASPDSDSISVGVKAVKDYAAGENGTLTPYVGLRYLRLSTDDFTASNGLRYEGDDQDLVIVPVGVNYTASISHGKWSVRPYAGIGYVWTAGDRSADQTVMLGTAADSFSYDTADSGSFIARAGVTTDCGDMSYGIGYSWQKGDSVSNNAWTLSASYHF